MAAAATSWPLAPAVAPARSNSRRGRAEWACSLGAPTGATSRTGSYSRRRRRGGAVPAAGGPRDAARHTLPRTCGRGGRGGDLLLGFVFCVCACVCGVCEAAPDSSSVSTISPHRVDHPWQQPFVASVIAGQQRPDTAPRSGFTLRRVCAGAAAAPRRRPELPFHAASVVPCAPSTGLGPAWSPVVWF